MPDFNCALPVYFRVAGIVFLQRHHLISYKAERVIPLMPAYPANKKARQLSRRAFFIKSKILNNLIPQRLI